jgi:ATP-dependent Lhr-like helicase
LRAAREPARDRAARPVVLLAAADPANPYGAAIAWPRRSDADRRPFQRAAGAHVVLVDGVAALYVDRGGSSLQVLPAADDPEIAADAAAALTGLLPGDGRSRELVITKVDGEPVGGSPFREALIAAGFVAGYRGLVLRRAVDRPSTGTGPGGGRFERGDATRGGATRGGATRGGATRGWTLS